MIDWRHEARARLRLTSSATDRTRDLVDETADHLRAHYEALRGRGLSHDDAFAEVVGELEVGVPHDGNASPSWMEGLLRDVRSAIRTVLRAPAFAVVAVTIMAIGIGASATMFSAIDTILVRAVPYPDADRLVAISETNRADAGVRGVSAAMFTELQRATSFGAVSAWRYWGYELGGTPEPERLRGARVSASHFALLGVRAVAGRVFVTGDDAPGQPKRVVLGEALWRRRFGGDTSIVGRSLDLNGDVYTVVGIVPAGFALPDADLWVPLVFASYELDQRGTRALSVVGRLAPAATASSAQGELDAIAERLARQHPESNGGWGARENSLREEVTGAARTPLTLLYVATVLVLAAACVNVANLLLARGAVRRRAIAIRLALGAQRRRVMRQILGEVMLLSFAGATGGLLLAMGGTAYLSRLDASAYALPSASGVGAAAFGAAQLMHVDLAVVAYVTIVAIAVAAVIGLAPAIDAARLDPASLLRGESGGRQSRWSRLTLRDLPVVAQTATATTLLIGGALVARSFREAQRVPLGFEPAHVLSFNVSLPASRYASSGERALFFDRAIGAIHARPGVQGAAVVSHLPLAGGALETDLTIEGRPLARGGERPTAQVVNVSGGYFAAMRVALLAGRTFDARDRERGQPVVVVDSTLAERYWPHASPIGKRMRLGGSIGADTAWREIVGVVGPVRADRIETAARPMVYVAYSQNAWPSMTVVARTDDDALRYADVATASIRTLDPSRPVYNVRSMTEIVDRQLAPRRLQTSLLLVFALAAVLLAITSVHGMLAFAVAQRSREIGVRAALGATRRAILVLCLRRAMSRVLVGIAAGAVLAIATSRVLQSVLYGVDASDPGTIAGVIVLLALAALLGALIPAVRAASLDPMRSLRAD